MLTREEIINEPVGRRLDAWVAEKVMGGVRKSLKTFAPRDKEYWEFSETNQPWVEDWNPSENISAAWEVVEKMKGNGEFEVYWYIDHWQAWFGKHETVKADTAPEAICKAALLAVTES